MILEQPQKIKEIDKSAVYSSLVSLPEQCLHSWQESIRVEPPSEYSDIDNIVFCGMGGSGLAARVIETVFADELKIPLSRVNDYSLPSFVGKRSLVICSSYSGSTEEVINNAEQAEEKEAKWLAISTGGKLQEYAQAKGVPFYKINPKHNPSNQPRMAIGYSIVGQLAMVSKLGIINIQKEDIDSSMEVMKKIISENNIDISSENNLSKKIANKAKDKIIILMSSSHLVGATHVFNNQLNENSKVFSSDFVIPELNHHLMEGLKHPFSNKDNLFVLLINSSLYGFRIKKRLEITQDVISKNNIPAETINISSENKLDQVFELIQLGGFINFYLAMLYEQNPAPIPWVDYFKEKLSK